MRVIEVRQFGGPEVLVAAERPEPTPGAGEVVVAVAAVPVLFLETQLRAGWGRDWFTVTPPYVPGGAVAGTVVEVGPGAEQWLGEAVVGRTGVTGSYAERALVPESDLTRVPAGVDLRTAAALVQDGRTALRLMEVVPVHSTDTVLVTAAGGALGLLLVQLAKEAGATVIGAARGKRKLDLVAEQGADRTVDYGEPGWTDGLAADVVFDGAGGALGLAAFGTVTDGGRFSAHGAPAGGFAPIDATEADRRRITRTGIAEVQISPADNARLLPAALVPGRLRPVIGQTFPLERAADAHRALADRAAPGKTLLIP